MKMFSFIFISYDDVFAENTNSEARILLGVGYGIMGIFVVLVIGKFNRLEHRVRCHLFLYNYHPQIHIFG